jgi:hypothetical protein
MAKLKKASTNTMIHNQLTIVSVFGHNDGSAAIPAILKSMEELPGSRGLLLSIEKPKNLPPEIEWKQIHNLNYKQYTLFMMHSLYAFIETDYCLTVQEDGWVLNGNNLTEKYYEYDYIGPITHCAIKMDDSLTSLQHLFLQFHWCGKADSTTFVIQNGGFSLRSKRFLEACNVHGITHTTDLGLKLNIDGKEELWTPIWNEDVQLSGMLRPKLMRCGYKYAPIDVAMQFGVEYLHTELHKTMDFNTIVGHHAKSRVLMADDTIKLPSNAGILGMMEKRFVEWLRDTKKYKFILDSEWQSKFGQNSGSKG